MGDGNKSASGGIGFVGLLTILFIALKLCHVIEWSWGWVLSPLWFSALLVVVFILVMAVIYTILDR